MKSQVKFAACAVALLMPVGLADAQRNETRDVFEWSVGENHRASQSGCRSSAWFNAALNSAIDSCTEVAMVSAAPLALGALAWSQHFRGNDGGPMVLNAHGKKNGKAKGHSENGNSNGKGHDNNNTETPPNGSTPPATTVPEPFSMLLVATGMGAVGLARRRRKALQE